jgi:hypothetical protein
MRAILVFGLLGLTFGSPGLAAPNHDHAAVNMRGDHVMGFSHEKTTHHFRLYADGGAIVVIANTRKDTETRDRIRLHLSHIAVMFATGNFHDPILIHDQTPPGVVALQRLKRQVSYRFEELLRGGRVRITTTNEEALAAIHEFLKFQISGHHTGDSLNPLPPVASRPL